MSNVTSIAKHQPTDIFKFGSASMADAREMATMIAQSDFVPKDYKGKPGNVLVAVQMGSELGLKPMQAMQNIAVINGRPCLWGDSLLALVQANPVCEWVNESFDDNTFTATCEAKRTDSPHPQKSTFSKADATNAGLFNKAGPWKSYPKRMLQMRARAFCLRNTFADVLGGLQVAEEIQDIEPAVETQVDNAKQVLGGSDNATPPVEQVEYQQQEEIILPEPIEPEVLPEEVVQLAEMIEGAPDLQELNALVPDMSNAPEESKEYLRNAFRIKLNALKEAMGNE